MAGKGRVNYTNDYGFTMPPSEQSVPHTDAAKAGKQAPADTGIPTEPDYADDAGNVTLVDENPSHKTRMIMGWLVGITGECRGVDFRLHSGENKVGRGEDMDIRLTDGHIDRSAVISIYFDPMNNRYYVSHGGGSCLPYVNREPVIGTRALEAFDRIQLAWEKDGSAEIICELLFVPLCGEKFSWSQTEKGIE
ncbi:MAG: hypothetical protein IJ899_10420 [Blautia sp.]|nr:hypothetical protein [Blautia sp.]